MRKSVNEVTLPKPEIRRVNGVPYGPLTVGKAIDKDKSIPIISPHPSAPTSQYGYIVARVGFSMVDGDPSPESVGYARLFALAPDLLEAAADVIADLQLFVSRQGPGPDRRLARLRWLVTELGGEPPREKPPTS